MLNIPYFKQDTGYSCGPTVVQMILKFYGKMISEKDLMEHMHTKKDVGTFHHAVIETLREHGLYTYVNNESTTDELRYLNELGHPVIVHFLEESSGEGHYSVVVDIGDEDIVLNDPYNGEGLAVKLIEFVSRWKNAPGESHAKQWLLAVSDTEFPIGKQYSPLETE